MPSTVKECVEHWCHWRSWACWPRPAPTSRSSTPVHPPRPPPPRARPRRRHPLPRRRRRRPRSPSSSRPRARSRTCSTWPAGSARGWPPGPRSTGRPLGRSAASTPSGTTCARQSFRVPAGDSWGVPVAAGRRRSTWWHGRRPRCRHALPAGRRAPGHVAVAPGPRTTRRGSRCCWRPRDAGRWHRATCRGVVAFGGEEPVARATSSTTSARCTTWPQCPRPSATTCAGWCRWTGSVSARSYPRVRGRHPDRARMGWRGRPRGTDPVAVGPDNTASDHESFAERGCPRPASAARRYAAYHSAPTCLPSSDRPSSDGSAGSSGLAPEAAEPPEPANIRPPRRRPTRGARSRRPSGRARSRPPLSSSPQYVASRTSPSLVSMSSCRT